MDETKIDVTAGIIQTISSDDQTKISLSKRRWFMLLIFSWLSLTNSLNWITFAPIATTIEQEYSVGPLEVNFLSMVFMIVFIPGIFPASYLVDTKSLRTGFILGAVLNAIGAIVRVLPWPFYDISDIAPYSFIPVAVGQTITAMAQTFILGLPPKLAQNWFGEKERVTATAIGALANQLGIAVGFYLCPFVVPEGASDWDVTLLLLIMAGFGIIALFLIVVFFRSKPIRSPSRSSLFLNQQVQNVTLTQATLTLLRDWSYMNLLICFGIVIGSFYSISTLLNQMLEIQQYSSNTTSLVGTILVVVGIFGAYIFGWLADKTRAYKLLLIICVFGTMISMVFFTLVFDKMNSVLLCIAGGMLGFFLTALLPLCMDISVEISFPLPEAIVCNLLLLSAQVFGIILISACTPLMAHVGVEWVNYTTIIILAISCVLILLFNGKNKRLNAEEQSAN